MGNYQKTVSSGQPYVTILFWPFFFYNYGKVVIIVNYGTYATRHYSPLGVISVEASEYLHIHTKAVVIPEGRKQIYDNYLKLRVYPTFNKTNVLFIANIAMLLYLLENP